MTRTVTTESSLPKLVIAKADAMRHLAGQLEDAMQVRNLRIRTSTALDSARELKLRWCQRTTEMLSAIFGDAEFASQSLAWVGKILPEYADLGLFIEQFQEEMDHHIAKTKALLKAVQKVPDPTTKTAASAATDEKGPQSSPLPESHEKGKKNNHQPKPSQEQEYQDMINGMMLIHGDCGDSVAQVGSFVKPLGISLVSANSDGQEPQPVATTMAAQSDLAFALVLDSDAPPPDPAHDSCNGLSFDLGYCVGRLGLGRVFVLQPRASQPYTDRHGIAHLPLDPAGGWQLQLARQLKRGGIEIDLNKLC